MSEFFYTRIIITHMEGDVVLGEKKTRMKISLKDIRVMYESFDDDDKKCIIISYHDCTDMTIYDDFDRVDKLHDKYLQQCRDTK